MSNQIETQIDVTLTERNRLTALFRIILVVPMAIFVASFAPNWSNNSDSWTVGLLILPAALAIVFRQIYPSYLLAFNEALLSLQTRVDAYVLLLTDEYPSIERNPNVAVLLPDVDSGRKLNRGLPLIKWFLAIPLVIVGLIYSAVALIATFFAWVTTLSSGTYPKWALDIVLGTIKFWNRVYGYAIILVTDEYPSFAL